MPRLLWIVPAVFVFALTGYLLMWSTAAPANQNQQTQSNLPAFADRAAPDIRKVAQQPTSPDLPITQVILYSSGVGYFQRDGHVEGNAKIDLAFPVQDINDLLKSMVLQDLGGGKVSAVGYDSLDPLDKTLNSFAIQLTGNPSHAQILNQARGQNVQIALNGAQPTAAIHAGYSPNTPGYIQGIVMGVEQKQSAAKENTTVEMLNLWCADGIRSIPLADVQRLKFTNPTVESEIGRALDVLASSQDKQKKAVALQFTGAGKRPVRVGYVVETPLWRTSYRLLIDKEGRPFIQGWALVENQSNEDWKDVRIGLVSGRPISFQMDLYQPLYVPRPVVQPELYANVRPTLHNGVMMTGGAASTTTVGFPFTTNMPNGSQVNLGNGVPPTAFQITAGPTKETAATPAYPVPGQTRGGNYWVGQDYFGAAGGAAALGGRGQNQPQIDLQRGILAATNANDLGDSFQYTIEHAVTIPRQKSALLPIVNKALDGDKVCVYNPLVQPKYPLLALRLTNTTGMSLMQGPVAVFEGNGYCGDAQMPNLQPKEERIVSYALDLGTEVETISNPSADEVKTLRISKGVLTVTGKFREKKTYNLKNRGPHDRIVLVEHPYRPEYKVIGKEQPKERARDVYRFEVKVTAGQTANLEVLEEQDIHQNNHLINIEVDTFRHYLQGEFSDPKAKAALQEVVALRGKQMKARHDSAILQKQLADITADQARLRANLKEMPPEAAAYKRYLEKFDSQETAIEKLQAQIQELNTRAQKEHEACAAFLASLDLQTTIRFPPGGIAAPDTNVWTPGV